MGSLYYMGVYPLVALPCAIIVLEYANHRGVREAPVIVEMNGTAYRVSIEDSAGPRA